MYVCSFWWISHEYREDINPFNGVVQKNQMGTCRVKEQGRMWNKWLAATKMKINTTANLFCACFSLVKSKHNKFVDICITSNMKWNLHYRYCRQHIVITFLNKLFRYSIFCFVLFYFEFDCGFWQLFSIVNSFRFVTWYDVLCNYYRKFDFHLFAALSKNQSNRNWKLAKCENCNSIFQRAKKKIEYKIHLKKILLANEWIHNNIE